MKKKREEYEIYFGPLHNLSQDTSFNYPILPDDGLGVPSNNDIKPTEWFITIYYAILFILCFKLTIIISSP